MQIWPWPKVSYVTTGSAQPPTPSSFADSIQFLILAFAGSLQPCDSSFGGPAKLLGPALPWFEDSLAPPQPVNPSSPRWLHSSLSSLRLHFGQSSPLASVPPATPRPSTPLALMGSSFPPAPSLSLLPPAPPWSAESPSLPWSCEPAVQPWPSSLITLSPYLIRSIWVSNSHGSTSVRSPLGTLSGLTGV